MNQSNFCELLYFFFWQYIGVTTISPEENEAYGYLGRLLNVAHRDDFWVLDCFGIFRHHGIEKVHFSSSAITIKSFIKAVADVQFFNFLVWPPGHSSATFIRGCPCLYAMFWVCKTREINLARCDCTVKVKLYFGNVRKLFQDVDKLFGKERQNLSLHGRYGLPFFKPRLLLECGSCTTWVWRCGFYLSAATSLAQSDGAFSPYFVIWDSKWICRLRQIEDWTASKGLSFSSNRNSFHIDSFDFGFEKERK